MNGLWSVSGNCLTCKYVHCVLHTIPAAAHGPSSQLKKTSDACLFSVHTVNSLWTCTAALWAAAAAATTYRPCIPCCCLRDGSSPPPIAPGMPWHSKPDHAVIWPIAKTPARFLTYAESPLSATLWWGCLRSCSTQDFPSFVMIVRKAWKFNACSRVFFPGDI